ncbi:MAG TPA: DUF4097 family beta strand repeat-containing protein [Gemmatimonadales bacterium]|nr:DUF4097 family beta strand repeat-containing protein [Gemmatimonadales bacterium]
MTALRFLPLAALWAAPLAAQAAGRHSLQGSEVAVYDLIGTVQIDAGGGDAVVVQVTPDGADAAQLKVAEGNLGGRPTLRVVYPGDRFQYPKMDRGSTEVRVRDDGTFGDHGHHHHDDDDDIDSDGRRVRISSSGGGLSAWADLKLSVPAGHVVILHLAVGQVTATNVDGQLRLSTVSAPITVTGTKGSLMARVGAGDVRVSGMEGDIEAETGSGNVELTRARGHAVTIETGSGTVTASTVEAEHLSVETGSGDVKISGAKAPRVGLETGSGTVTVELTGQLDRLDIETGSGDVAITAPANLGAELAMDTGSGDISTDFPLTVTRTARDHLRGTVGDGKGRITVETGSGGVRLLKARSS